MLATTAAAPVAAEDRVVVDLPLPPLTRPGPATETVAESLPAPAETAPASEPPAPPPAAATAIPEAPDAPAHQHAAAEPPGTRLTVERGQSLYTLFDEHGFSQRDLALMLRSGDRIAKRLSRLQPGQIVEVHARDGGEVQRMVLEWPGPEDLVIEREGDSFDMARIPDAPDPEPDVAPASETTQGMDADGGGPLDPREPITRHHVRVAAGDSLYSIFLRLRVPATDLAAVLAARGASSSLRRLMPGQELSLGLGPEGRLETLGLELDDTRTLRAVRTDDGFRVDVEEHPLEHRVVSASAVIENSLFLAGQRAGLSDRLIMELTEIFGWDVDFALDVRAGDRFTVVFEELYKDGEKIGDGEILASEFVNRGREIRALRYAYEDGRAEYFSPEGLSMRKAFLRTPVKFSRISSRFSRGRMHPVLQRMRSHKGVDYAAPTGTPIKAAGDGRVVFAGWKGGYGKAVVLQHGSTYTTLYGHLSGIKRGVRSGVRVRQGQIIGFVGQTGLATGPHLHYEFRVRGMHKDPLRVKLPAALPIEKRYRDDFLLKSRPLVVRLDALAQTSIAATD